MSYGKILVGTDGSATARIAEQAAARLARACQAQLVIATAHEPPDRSEAAAGEILERARADAAGAGVEAEVQAKEDEPADAIMELAEAGACDLIVVGNRGMGAARRFVLGGVPDRISHYAPCDLLIVKTADRDPQARPPGWYERVLVGTDGSATADEASRRGADLATRLGAAVELIYVGDAAMGTIVLKDTAGRLGDPAIPTWVVQGDPADRICEVARREGHDLVVVGNRGMAGARRYVLAAVPNKVSHNATTDVLIARTVGRTVDDLGSGQGAIVSAAGRRVAAYRDEAGTVHAVSSRCTHMGCTVRWNDRDRTWDCPCHGSRYDLDGHVTQGPAEKDLTRVELE